jgi:hypothetical protein
LEAATVLPPIMEAPSPPDMHVRDLDLVLIVGVLARDL